MKKAILSSVLLLSLGVTLSTAQAQSKDVRVVSTQQPPSAFDGNNSDQSANHTVGADPKAQTTAPDSSSKAIKQVSISARPSDGSSASDRESNNRATSPDSSTSVYRVGVGDVLDIQLLNSPIRESTLYSVLAGGLLEYPLAGEAIRIQGLTTDEIARILTPRIKIYAKPQVAIYVREYASHNVIVTGLVRDPGTKALRREAVPLFVLLAEAQPRSDAGRAIIMRPGSPTQTVDISDTSATSVLIYPNDVIRLVAPLPIAPQFFYIVGQIVMPGQRDFQKGMTLTQAIYASGGKTHSAGRKAKVMRQGADGRLVTTEYNLKQIEQGKDPDPPIEAGDRIEVSRSGW